MAAEPAPRRPLARAAYALYAAAVWAAILVLVFPLLWMIGTAFKPAVELLAIPPTLLPRALTGEHFVKLLAGTPFLGYFRNSAVVATLTTL
ncbi:MAG: carbohydrate ABC transporter permease, partial [Alphaproteobacteria bacterium]|nr:carbohydrate ABC transporter permease [Alphaproteobacteria bacterium]